MTRRDWIVGIVLAVVSSAALVFWGETANWDTGTALGVSGLAVSVWGFAIAITEVRKTATLTRATAEAVRRTLKAVAASRLAVAITQLRQIVLELEESAADNDSLGARRAVNNWRWIASEADGLLRRRFGDQLPSLGTIQSSLELARSIKPALFEEGSSVRDVTAECLAAMEKAADQLAPLIEQLLPTIDED